MLFAYGLLAWATYRKYLDTRSANVFGLLVVNTAFLAVYAVRRETAAVDTTPRHWLLAFFGTFLPLLMRPTSPGASTVAGDIVQVLGLVAILAALLSLRRSFGIVPAHRGIRTGGLYRFVRHPLYAAELLALAGVAVANPSPWNALLWVAELALQLARARAEEGFLDADPEYARYRARVRYRLVPRIL